MIKHWKRFSAFYLIGIGVLLIAISPFVRGRFDLSEDGKYTLSESSEVILESIDAPLLVQVYLGGDDLPGGLQISRFSSLMSTTNILPKNPALT
ncbi:MAG: hypothetical protein NTX34_06100 [Cytophagales bacterium]|nr:hypothetical protein [Cytophagales bacterium]